MLHLFLKEEVLIEITIFSVVSIQISMTECRNELNHLGTKY